MRDRNKDHGKGQFNKNCFPIPFPATSHTVQDSRLKNTQSIILPCVLYEFRMYFAFAKSTTAFCSSTFNDTKISKKWEKLVHVFYFIRVE